MKIRKNQSSNGKKKNSVNIEDLDLADLEDEGFIEGDFNFGRSVATFSFDGQKDTVIKDSIAQDQSVFCEPLKSNVSKERVVKPSPKGITPPIDGEQYTAKRCHQYNYSKNLYSNLSLKLPLKQ